MCDRLRTFRPRSSKNIEKSYEVQPGKRIRRAFSEVADRPNFEEDPGEPNSKLVKKVTWLDPPKTINGSEPVLKEIQAGKRHKRSFSMQAEQSNYKEDLGQSNSKLVKKVSFLNPSETANDSEPVSEELQARKEHQRGLPVVAVQPNSEQVLGQPNSKSTEKQSAQTTNKSKPILKKCQPIKKRALSVVIEQPNLMEELDQTNSNSAEKLKLLDPSQTINKSEPVSEELQAGKEHQRGLPVVAVQPNVEQVLGQPNTKSTEKQSAQITNESKPILKEIQPGKRQKRTSSVWAEQSKLVKKQSLLDPPETTNVSEPVLEGVQPGPGKKHQRGLSVGAVQPNSEEDLGHSNSNPTKTQSSQTINESKPDLKGDAVQKMMQEIITTNGNLASELISSINLIIEKDSALTKIQEKFNDLLLQNIAQASEIKTLRTTIEDMKRSNARRHKEK